VKWVREKGWGREEWCTIFCYLLPLIAQDLLEMTIPNKTNSRLKKYKTTTAGEEFVKNRI
jgi:predicted transcriptional regulator